MTDMDASIDRSGSIEAHQPDWPADIAIDTHDHPVTISIAEIPAAIDGSETVRLTRKDGGQSILEEVLAERFGHAATLLTVALMREFGSLAATLSASPERLTRAIGVDGANYLRSIRRAMLHCLVPQPLEQPIVKNSDALLAYLHFELQDAPREHVRVLYLDSGHRLIRDEMAISGTISSAALPVREVIGRARELGAPTIVLVHNHPVDNRL